MIRLFLPFILLFFFALTSVFAQALPSPTVGSAVTQSVSDYVIKKGFAANDPRILETTKAIQQRVLANGGSWGKILAKASPIGRIISGGIVVHELSLLLEDSNQIFMKEDETFLHVTPGTNIDYGAIQVGTSAYLVIGPYQCVGSTPEAAAVCYKVRSQAIDSIVDVVLTAVTPGTTPYTNGIRYGATVNYRVSPGATIQQTGYQVYTHSPTVNCPPGTVYYSSACTALDPKFANKGAASSQYVTWDALMSYLNNPSAKATIDDNAVANLWRDAASQPGYAGLPAPAVGVPVPLKVLQPSVDPLQAPSVAPYKPTLSDLSLNPSTDPVANPDSQIAEPVNPASSQPLVNLGSDPGIAPPQLEELPTQLFKPIEDLFTDWKTWVLPAHSSTCPTFSIAPSIAGHVFDISLDSHCGLIEDHRSTILAAAMLCWICAAVFIVLEA